MMLKKLFELINLDYKGLESIRDAKNNGNYEKAIDLYMNFIKNRRDRALYLDKDINLISQYCLENFKEETREIIRVANEVKDQKFVFGFKWDMERTHVPVTFQEEIDWSNIPFDDEEWVFMLNRHRYWIALGQAYALTGDESYAKVYFEQLEHWIDKNPLSEELYSITWRTIEAGIRCENWIKSFMYFKESEFFTSNILVKFIISLSEHGRYIYDKYDYFRKLSNWGVLENHGLFILSVFLPELKDGEKYRINSLKRLEEQINLQVMRDGMHWEQSPMYHNEVLHCYLDTINIANKNNINLNSDIVCKTKDLAYADLYMSKPNYHQPIQSDSDDTDLRDMLTKAAYLLRDGELKFRGYPYIDFESIWELGFNSLEEYRKIQAIEPKYKSYGFQDSGNYYMRSGWDESDNYLYFHCGTLGSGHGHADLLHFDIHAHGDSILTDSGRYTYVEDNEYRKYMKSCRAHNTTLVDDTDFTLIEGAWTVSKAALPIKQSFVTAEEYDYVEGGHLGYMDLENPVFVNRKVMYVKPNYWVVIDEFYTRGMHNYKQFFHFDDGKVVCSDSQVEFEGDNCRLKLFHINNNLEKEVIKVYISKQYNKLEKRDKLVCTLNNSGFTSIISILYTEHIDSYSNISCEKVNIYKADGRLVPLEEAEAVKIKISEEEEHIIVVSHGEACVGKKLYIIEGIPIYGKAALIKKLKQENKTFILRY